MASENSSSATETRQLLKTKRLSEAKYVVVMHTKFDDISHFFFLLSGFGIYGKKLCMKRFC